MKKFKVSLMTNLSYPSYKFVDKIYFAKDDESLIKKVESELKDEYFAYISFEEISKKTK